MQIEKERFEAWLMSQPRDKRLVYSEGLPSDQPGCLVCNFLRETLSRECIVAVEHATFQDNSEKVFFPEWLNELLFKVRRPLANMPGDYYRGEFSIGDAQDTYVLLQKDFGPSPNAHAPCESGAQPTQKNK